MKVLAHFLEKFGIEVTGSDNKLSGHNINNVIGADYLVYTCAISQDNVELVYGKEHNIPIIERAQLLAELSTHFNKVISISGSHGKSTTTLMCGSVLDSLKPCVHMGGEYEEKEFSKDIFITEACEYRAHFLLLKSHIGVILNTDFDHPDYYQNETELINAYLQFSKNSYITLINGDDKNAHLFKGNRVLTFGLKKTNMFYASLLTHDKENKYSFALFYQGTRLGCFDLNVSGKHNIYNGVASIIVGFILGLDYKTIYNRLNKFTGLKRRWEYITLFNNCPVYTDYAHHPKEINALYENVKNMGYKRNIIVFEPHTYSRTKAFFSEFVKVLSRFDEIILPPIYPSREKFTTSISSEMIVKGIRKYNKNAHYFSSYKKILKYLSKIVKKGDIILTVGAGTINTLIK